MLNFKKTDKQQEACLLMRDYPRVALFGGSQSGKTFIIVRAIIIRALKVTRTNHFVGRIHLSDAKPALWHNTIPDVMRLCFPNVKVKKNKSDFYIEFENESKLWIGGLDDENRTEKILGNKYSSIFLDEATHIPYSALNIMSTRLSQKSELTNRIYCAFNPEFTSHWTYRLFLSKCDPITRAPLQNPKNYGHLLMNPTDNLDNLGVGYVETCLDVLPEKDRQRFKKGEFQSDNDKVIIREHWWKYFNCFDDIAHKLTGMFITCDTAYKVGTMHDFSVFQLWAYSSSFHLYLIDQVRAKFTFPDLVKAINDFVKKSGTHSGIIKPARLYIEDKVSGISLIQTLNNAGMKGIIPWKPKDFKFPDDKVGRAKEASILIEQGSVSLNKGALWLRTFLFEVSEFTGEDKNNWQLGKHDDQVDAMTMAISIWRAFGGGNIRQMA